MKMSKFLHIFFMSAIAIAMSACVPKATEKKAVCGVNEAFNNVTRSCYSIVAPNKAPVASNITPISFNEDTESLIRLTYSDVDLDLATSCALTNLTNVTVTSNCVCDAGGVCIVGVTGTTNYNGAASFSYSVKANNMVSNSATASFSILPINDAPVISAIAAQSTNEDTAKSVSFTLTDVDNTVSCASSVSVTGNTDTTLIPNTNINISGTAPNCIATITPAANLSGASDITLQATDGTLSATRTFTLTVVAINDAPTISFISNPASINEDGSTVVNFTIGDVDSVITCTAGSLSASLAIAPDVNIVYGGAYPNCTATLTPSSGHYGSNNITFTVTDTLLGTSGNAFTLTILPVNDRPDMSAISWATSSVTPTTSGSGITWSMTTRENSTASPSTTYADITVNPDVTNTGYETSQTLTLTAVSDNQILLKDANISVSVVSATVLRVSFVTEKNQSGTALVNLTLKDNGGTSNGGVDTHLQSIALTVSPVDDPPYFASSIDTSDTNEGGALVAGPFNVDEDEGSTDDENINQITITAVSSDNPSVLPDSAISIFYDENDNGVEDTAEARTIGVALDAAGATIDANAHNFYFKLKPVAGVSGNSNITFTVSDGTVANDVTKTFSLIVHPIAALHGGWSNISAIGIKSDKNDAPVAVKTDSSGALLATSDIKCDYNKSTDVEQCNTNQNCTGTSAPHGIITPDAVNVVYWDSGNKKCYRSQSSSKFSWVELTTSCPITRAKSAPTTLTTAIDSSASSMTVGSTNGFLSAGTLIVDSEQISYTGKTATTFTGLSRGVNSTTAASHSAGASIPLNTGNGVHFIEDLLATPSQITPTASEEDQYYYDSASKYCYKSYESTPGVWAWDTATPYYPSKVTLSWNAFTVSGSGPDASVGVYGWNVYRRESGQDYDFQHGFLKVNSTDTMTISNSTTRTFTDTTAVAGKVYYYLVRPVDDTTRHLTISTPEIFSEVRVLAPTPNYSFVHRWMVNQEVCNSMLMTTTTTNKVDPTKNYRCPYFGPGESTLAPGYYDIEKDMLVDISEVGCPYTPASTTATVNCTADGCVGIGDPTTAGYTAPDASVYYDRSSGSCWYNQAGTWTDTNSALGAALIAAKKVSSSLNPPLVNINKTNAGSVCSARSTASATPGLTAGAIAATLPEKKEYIAYSAGALGDTDAVLTDMEQGFSLNVQSRCNSSNANGLEVAYTDSNIPSTSYIYSISGTASSGIKSLYTGSVPWVNNYSTETCSSRYGIQDVYGNVAEWVKDSMTCPSIYVCTSVAGTSLGNYDFDTAGAGTSTYAFDLLTGPYNDASGDSTTAGSDAFLTDWDFKDEFFGAGKFSFPVGMPINVDIATSNASLLSASAALPFLLDVGPTSGITTNQLHEDGIIVNGTNINNVAINPTQTGSFAQGGSYLSGQRAGRYSSELVPDAIVRPDIGFRCIIPVVNGKYPLDPNRHTYPY